MSVLVDSGRVADRGLHAARADEANRDVPVFVEVVRRQGLGARAVLERHARDEDRQRHGRPLRHRAQEERHLDELGAVRVNIST